jgi:hypothetical protein
VCAPPAVGGSEGSFRLQASEGYSLGRTLCDGFFFEVYVI